ncbi:MAG: G5 domain-containing protein [Arcanobacterium sp.]|nr:G5 domain-containing protein [Arcanobacterium sp.]
MSIIEAAKPADASSASTLLAQRGTSHVTQGEPETRGEHTASTITISRDARITKEIPVVRSLPASSSEVESNTFAEHMNANLVAGCALRDGSSGVSRIRLFTRSRAVVAAMVAATCGMSVGAMAATPDSPKQSDLVSTMTLTDAASEVGSISGLADVSFTVHSAGKTRELTAKMGTTLDQALNEAGYVIDADDEVSLGLDSLVREGMEIKIVTVDTKTVTEDFTDAFEEKREDDDSLPKGEERVETEGVDGKGLRTFTVTYRDGEEASRTLVAQTMQTKRVDKVVKVGTGDSQSVASGANGPVSVPNRVVSGSKADWMRAAGIPESQWGYVDYIVSKESSWNPNAVNPSSGACGLAQALPCSKMGGNWNDPVVALRWQYGYVNSRYGGYAGAVAHSKATGWY